MALVLVGAIASWLLYRWIGPSPFVPVEGVSIFALFYIVAQSLERLLEPIANGLARRVPLPEPLQETAGR
jgi:hypothetical protein